jgi:hypothetical protein
MAPSNILVFCGADAKNGQEDFETRKTLWGRRHAARQNERSKGVLPVQCSPTQRERENEDIAAWINMQQLRRRRKRKVLLSTRCIGQKRGVRRRVSQISINVFLR